MTEEMILAEEKRWRREYSEMFSHPELQEGEIWIGNKLADLVLAQIVSYRSGGVPSARHRIGFLKEFKGNQLTYYPMFMNLRELIIANKKCKKEAVTAPARP